MVDTSDEINCKLSGAMTANSNNFLLRQNTNIEMELRDILCRRGKYRGFQNGMESSNVICVPSVNMMLHHMENNGRIICRKCKMMYASCFYARTIKDKLNLKL
jgi:hypothetical protein